MTHFTYKIYINKEEVYATFSQHELDKECLKLDNKDKEYTIVKAKVKKICKLTNDKLSWILEVDNKTILFDGSDNAEYFSKLYTNLGYAIKWDRNKWKRN